MLVQKFGMGYCPIVLQKERVLQYNYCIAGWKVAWPKGDVVSQYKKCIVVEIWPRGLYCKRRSRVYCRNCIAIWCIVAKKGLGG